MGIFCKFWVCLHVLNGFDECFKSVSVDIFWVFKGVLMLF